MYTIIDDLKSGNIRNIYLLHGAEHYLVVLYKKKLLQALCNTSDRALLREDMNFTHFHGKDTTIEQIIEVSETMPFFAEKRVVLIEDVGLFGKEGDVLADYINKMPSHTYFIFVDENTDKRSCLYKAIEKNGHAAEFKIQTEENLKKWIASMVTKEGKKITVRAVESLMERCAMDMEQISRELEKLFAYTLEQEAIDLPEVEAVCTVRIGNHIFDMISAMANKRQKEALALYYELLALKEPPMRILFLISRQFMQLLTIKDLRNRGYDKKHISDKTQLKPFIVDKYMTQASKFTTEMLKNAIEDCAIYDEEVKKGLLSDRMCVELLLVKYSGGTK